jgi:hypothetical protein
MVTEVAQGVTAGEVGVREHERAPAVEGPPCPNRSLEEAWPNRRRPHHQAVPDDRPDFLNILDDLEHTCDIQAPSLLPGGPVGYGQDRLMTIGERDRWK